LLLYLGKRKYFNFFSWNQRTYYFVDLQIVPYNTGYCVIILIIYITTNN
jgi:hypothetical protein